MEKSFTLSVKKNMSVKGFAAIRLMNTVAYIYTGFNGIKTALILYLCPIRSGFSMATAD